MAIEKLNLEGFRGLTPDEITKRLDDHLTETRRRFEAGEEISSEPGPDSATVKELAVMFSQMCQVMEARMSVGVVAGIEFLGGCIAVMARKDKAAAEKLAASIGPGIKAIALAKLDAMEKKRGK